MKKFLKHMLVTSLSAGVLLSVGFPAEIQAQSSEETVESESVTSEAEEESSSEGESSTESESPVDIGMTDEELEAAIQPPFEYDTNNVLAIEELEAGLEELTTAIGEDSEGGTSITTDDLITMLGEPNTMSETGESEFLSYVAIEEGRVDTLVIQTYNNGEAQTLSNYTYENRTREAYEPLNITEAEFHEQLANETELTPFIDVLGEPDMVTYYAELGETNYTWLNMGNAEVADDEIVIIEAVENADGVIEGGNLGTAADMNESSSSSDTEESASSEETESISE